ncbi:MAG: hypothetical protein ACXAB4_11130, partial [Candidatus Hodarchaeales archaeon]
MGGSENAPQLEIMECSEKSDDKQPDSEEKEGSRHYAISFRIAKTKLKNLPFFLYMWYFPL